jgi:hypothetical protein
MEVLLTIKRVIDFFQNEREEQHVAIFIPQKQLATLFTL